MTADFRFGVRYRSAGEDADTIQPVENTGAQRVLLKHLRETGHPEAKPVEVIDRDLPEDGGAA